MRNKYREENQDKLAITLIVIAILCIIIVKFFNPSL